METKMAEEKMAEEITTILPSVYETGNVMSYAYKVKSIYGLDWAIHITAKTILLQKWDIVTSFDCINRAGKEIFPNPKFGEYNTEDIPTIKLPHIMVNNFFKALMTLEENPGIKIPKNPNIYEKSYSYAKAHNEVEEWNRSYLQNMKLKKIFETEGVDKYKKHKMSDFLTNIISQDGSKRLSYVLGRTIIDNPSDKLFADDYNSVLETYSYPDMWDNTTDMSEDYIIERHRIFVKDAYEALQKY